MTNTKEGKGYGITNKGVENKKIASDRKEDGTIIRTKG